MLNVPFFAQQSAQNRTNLQLIEQKPHSALRPILAGIIVFVLLNVIFTLGVTFSPLNPKFNFSYGNFLPVKLALLKKQPAQPDILFLGTSQTNNGFIPKVFEQAASGHPTSFNLGLPNNRYDIMLAYLQFHQQRFGKPNLVLIELSPSILEKNASIYFLPALYYRTLIEQAPALTPTYLSNPLLADNVKQEILLSGLSSLRQYRHTFSPVNVIRKVSAKIPKLHTHNANGTQSEFADSGEASDDTEGTFTENEAQFDPAWTEQGWYPKSQSLHMKSPEGLRLSVIEAKKYYVDQQPAVYFDKLQALLAYCQKENIPVALVSWPNHPAFLQEFQKSPLNTEYQQGLQQLLAQYSVSFINLNQDIPASQPKNQGGDFADPRHLTPKGAQYFTRKLAARLEKVPSLQAALKPKKPEPPLASADL